MAARNAKSHAQISLRAPPDVKKDTTEIQFFANVLCPYAQRTWMTLLEKNVDFELVEVDLKKKPDWYRIVNPAEKVPAIIDVRRGKQVVVESRDIGLYLESQYKEKGVKLVPDIVGMADEIWVWDDFVDYDVVPAFFSYLTATEDDDDSELEKELLESLQRFDEGIQGIWLTGDTFTLADVNALPFIHRLDFSLKEYKNWEIPSRFKNLHAWLQRAYERPSFKATRLPDLKLKELYEDWLSVQPKSAGNDGDFIFDPDFERLKKEVDQLRAQVSWQAESIRSLQQQVLVLKGETQTEEIPPQPLWRDPSPPDLTFLDSRRENDGEINESNVEGGINVENKEKAEITDFQPIAQSPTASQTKVPSSRDLSVSAKPKAKPVLKKQPINALGKVIWYSTEALGQASALFKGVSGTKVEEGISKTEVVELEESESISRTATLSKDEALSLLKDDCENAYFITGEASANLYESDCEFADPFASFKGYDRFAANLRNLQPFIIESFVKLLNFEEESGPPYSVNTKFMVRLKLGLPWKPEIAWVWGVRYEFSEVTGRVCRHIESWDISPDKAIAQLFRPKL
eukprot:CAMPEP_0167757234 /NCGR_PEP_ID=MMETSP0110_2-20121227/9813_1 /TAXON_ID=629695 /ORGANISM="Gymnochlora sp., Strain CCMP2014" /LENGTH=573 /DNA_ID=CAMNT_0007643403 /DNA_START=96 /DNA_END=1820 /DNA_ORIENTATION=+